MNNDNVEGHQILGDVNHQLVREARDRSPRTFGFIIREAEPMAERFYRLARTEMLGPLDAWNDGAWEGATRVPRPPRSKRVKQRPVVTE